MSDAATLIDVTVGIDARLPLWPGSTGSSLRPLREMARGDECNGSELRCDVHVGTHVDAPLHFIDDGLSVEKLSVAAMVGPAWVANCGEARQVDAAGLEALNIPRGTRRLLLRTTNSALWRRAPEFVRDYVALTPDAARWLVDRGFTVVGIDYLSIQRFADPPDVHTILLGAGVVVIEGLDLSEVEQGPWELLCLPLKLAGAEAAPARVLLRRGGGA